MDEIALAKRELIEGLQGPNSVAVLNADDRRVAAMASAAPGRVIFYGTEKPAEYTAEEIEDRGALGTAFTLVQRGKRTRIEMSLPGRHVVMNALAAMAAASVWNVGVQEAQRVFPNLHTPSMRGELVRFTNGFALINDAYNSSPAALQAMIGLLAATPGYTRRILAAGEMRELGPSSAHLHREGGEFAGKSGKVDYVIGVQGDAAQIVEGAVRAGLTREHTKFFATPAEAAAFLAGLVKPGDLLLVKRIAQREDGRDRRCAAGAVHAGRRAAERRAGATEMLYYLLYHVLQKYFSPLNVFRYITVRTVYASLTAMFLALVFGPWLIRQLRELQIGQFIREEGPQAHKKKAGTPTMGGVLIVLSTAVPTLLWADLSNPFILLSLFALLAFAAIGFVDDYAKVAKRQNLGLTGKKRSTLQFLVSSVVGIALLVLSTHSAYSTQLIVPFFKRFRPDLVIHSLLHSAHFWPLAFVIFLAFVALVITGSSNAVNLTDGLDGLAIGCTVIAAGALTVLTYVSSNFRWAQLSGDTVHPARRRIDGVLRGAGGRVAGLLVVQRASGGDLHGGRWLAGAGRNAGHDRGDHQAGSAAGVCGRDLRAGSGVGDFAGWFVQVAWKTNFPDGADSSPFRIAGLERDRK